MNRELLYQRLHKVRARMQDLGLEAMFLSPSANLEYLLGERRRKPTFAHLLWTNGWVMGAWITLEHEPFFTAPRMAADYELQNEAGWPVRVLEDDGHSTTFLKQIAADLGLAGKRVAIEDRAWSQFLIDLLRAAPTIEPTVASEVMAPIRAIKGPEELAMLQKAAEITDQVFGQVVQRMRLGDNEADVAAELDHQIRQLGAEPSMTTAVLGWGQDFPRQALDRDYLTKDPFTPGTVVDFDFGAIYQGYCTDFGRVVYFGEPTPEYLSAYRAVVEAEESAIAAMRGGAITAEALYVLALQIVEEAGFGAYSPDRLGHGIGMDIHEPPFLDKGIPDVLEAGMVFTVEPQIIKGPLLVRIEDLVVVGERGSKQLTHFSKEPLVIN
ncbi:MAG: aminopeptidase P family protein [Anaerolineae bacterium]|nr:aminopeptidase P family protein [Anaerolineae bacterium]